MGMLLLDQLVIYPVRNTTHSPLVSKVVLGRHLVKTYDPHYFVKVKKVITILVSTVNVLMMIY